MKKIVRISILIVFLVAVFFMGKSLWIEFSGKPASDRYSHFLYRQMMDLYRGVLGRVPFAAAHHTLANLYLDGGREAQAIGEYKNALQRDERFVPAYVALANIYLQRGSFSEASELLKKAEALIPGEPDIQRMKRQASLEYFLDAGAKAFEKGDMGGAREWLNHALEIDPRSAEVHYLLALSFDERQDFYQMEDYLRKAIHLDPQFFLARSFLGDVYLGRGDFESALGQYQASLAIRGDDRAVLNNMGIAYMDLERYGSAIECLEKALALDPSNVGIRHNLAVVYRDYRMLEKAAEGLAGIIRIQPGFPNVHNDLGDVYKKQGLDQRADKEYQASIDYGEKKLSEYRRDPFLLVELAHAYNGLKEPLKAKELVDEALLINPDNPKAYLTLADIYRNLNRPEAALEALDWAQKLSPREYLFIEKTGVDIREQMSQERR